VGSYRVAVGGEETSALFEPATGESKALFVCAHGAGGHMADRAMQAIAPRLRERGFDLVRFNFLYREKGSRRPDPMPLLRACFTAVVDHVRRELQPRKIVLGGRSMGGRVASMLAADGFACDGLLLLAYPLHPAGQPEKLRAAHLPQIRVPVLCVNGTRDDLCRRELMDRVVQTVSPAWEMHWIEHADHSFHVRKSSGRDDSEVLNELAEVAGRWVARP
jgi:predicted alpha/beta-hydrolase family hydrolase